MRFEPRARATMATCALTTALALLIAALNAAPVAADRIPPAATSTTQKGDAVAARERRVRTTVGVLASRTHVRAGRSAHVAGRVRPARAGRLVVLQRRSGPRWLTIERTRTRSGGRYVLRHRTRGSTSAALRVRVAGGTRLRSGTRRVGRLEAFRPALASWYGPGFYGSRTACGGILSPGTRGVAHKSLPCGTRVTIRYRGRQVRVPVVDRGPYIGGREFDLGPGVRTALRFDGVGIVQVAH